MMERSPIRKRHLAANEEAASAAREIDIAACAAIAYSSEDPAHPVEHLLDGRSDPGGTRWVSANPDSTERILVEFDRPQTISRLIYEVEEKARDRTQEVRVDISDDGGRVYRQILVQEYNFSPRGATFQREDLSVVLSAITHLRLTIVPNKNGAGAASLTTLRLFS
jgi:hypothetical protein